MHRIKFTHFKHTVQWVLVHVYIKAIATNQFENISITAKVPLGLLHSASAPTPQLQIAAELLSASIILLPATQKYINGVMQYVVLGLWLPLSSRMSVWFMLLHNRYFVHLYYCIVFLPGLAT